MLNHKTIFKQKSKILLIFICIFGLILYYGCRSDDGGITDPSTFSISAKSDNVVTSIVQSQKTIGELKIGFAASHDYTIDYTVEDSETDESKKLTKDDFQLANKVLTAKDSVATKVKLVDSSTGPTDKTITINFTFKANDTTLKNNTQTLSVDVTLTHAQKTQAQQFGEIIKSLTTDSDTITYKSEDYVRRVSFNIAEGSYDEATKTFTLKEMQNTLEDTDKVIDKVELRANILAWLRGKGDAPKYFASVEGGEFSEVSGNPNKIEFDATFTFNSKYETDIEMPIKIAVEKTKGGWKEQITK